MENALAEWLEADEAGGFASSTVGGERTRRYHALLLKATTPPTGRVVLVNGLEAGASVGSAEIALSTQRYAPGVVYPDITALPRQFSRSPWPAWVYSLPDGSRITHEVFVRPDTMQTVLRWSREGATTPCRLRVRLLLSGRDYHSLHSENPDFRFDAEHDGNTVAWRPYPGMPKICALTNGAYTHAPDWYRHFLYTAEQARGLDFTEDLASPGVLAFDLGTSEPAVIVLRAEASLGKDAPSHARLLAAAERRRRTDPLLLAAHSYRVARGRGRTLIAGFPWFTDWGRDTFIAMRGLVMVPGDLDTAEAILCAWAKTVSQGMLPNRFPDRGGAPEYNAVDASLWFVVAAYEFQLACAAASRAIPPGLRDACEAILAGYSAGTRYGIRADPDGLLCAGEPGTQLTWMDAKTGDRVVTPRIGKPVEVQALWINALTIGGQWDSRWRSLAAQARAAFVSRFVNPAGGLFDVADADHVAGRMDASIRPNQIFAVGGLPFPVLDGPVARGVVDVVEAHLLTPVGLRTLAPHDPAYVGRYQGGPSERDGAYHQGTVWPWLMGAFVQAWLAVRDGSEAAKAEAAARFLPPLMLHLDMAGLGHVSEVADGDPPHSPGGCPFQAWSLGELLRIRYWLGAG